MTTDFAGKLAEYGFGPEADFYDTTNGFYHDIHNLHHNEDTPALLYDHFKVEQQPDNWNGLIHCEVMCSPDTDLNEGVEAIAQHWVGQLRYQRPLYENIEVIRSGTVAKISCITIAIAGQLACTLTFMVRQHPDFVVEEVDGDGLSHKQAQQMLDTMDATFDGSMEEMLEKIKPARPGSDNDSRGK